MGGIKSTNFLSRCLTWCAAGWIAAACGCRTPPTFTPAASATHSPTPVAARSSSAASAAAPIELCSYASPPYPTNPPAAKNSLFQGPAVANGDQLTLDEALQLALEHSDIVRTLSGNAVKIAAATRYDPAIANEATQAALAEFDTSLATAFSWNRFEGPPNSFFGPGIDREDRRDEATLATGLTKRWLPGTQTRVAYNPSPGYLFFPSGSTGFNPTHVSALELEVRQPLLQGGGLAVNSAPITVAQLQTDQSAWEFKGALLDMVRSVEQAYWELYAARVARDVLQEQAPLIEEVVRVEEANSAAERAVGADVAKARTQLYLLQQRMVGANRVIRVKELQLGSLIGLGPHQHVSMVPISDPISAPILLDKQASVARAVNHQPSLVERRIETRVRELEMRVARNQYLPRLELLALYRANGLDDDLGNSLKMMFEQDFYDWQFGAAFSMPLGRNAPRARLQAAELELARENAELREVVRLTIFEINEIITRIEALHGEYRLAKQREEQAREWLRGATIRYENPPPAGRSDNWLLTALDDLLFALRAAADAAAEAAELLAEYNTELARLQQVEGSLLGKFNVRLQNEPWSGDVIEQLPKIEVPQENERRDGGDDREDQGNNDEGQKEKKDLEDKEAMAPPPSPQASIGVIPRTPINASAKNQENETSPRDPLRRLPPINSPYTAAGSVGVRPAWRTEGGGGRDRPNARADHG